MPDGARPAPRVSAAVAPRKSNQGAFKPEALIVDGSWDEHLVQTGGNVPPDGDTRRVVRDALELREFLMEDGTSEWIWVPTRPWSALCRLKLSFRGFSKEGTGTIIGPRTILTAAHNLYADGQDAVAITVVPGQFHEGHRPFGQRKTSSFAYHAGYQSRDENTAAQFDFGVVFLDDDTLTTLAGWVFPFQSIDDDYWENPSRLGWINVSGFPENTGGRLLWGIGQSKERDGNVIRHDVDTTPGESGAPIYWVFEDDYKVLGIHTEYFAGLNGGVRITDAIDAHLRRWVALPGSDQGATRL